jgi:hypothetical protein
MEHSQLIEKFKSEIDIKDCKVKEIQSGRFLLCLSIKPACPYFLKFGNDKFCQNKTIKVNFKHKK